MNTKKWAVLLAAMLSFDYATANYYGRYGGVPKTYANENEGYYGWNRGCRCNQDFTDTMDGSLDNIRGHFRKHNKDYDLRDNSVEEYQFRNGRLGGLHRFHRKGPYRCSLTPDYVRIIFSIGFDELLIYYYVSFVEEFFDVFFGGVFSFLGHLLGEVTNFLFRCALPDVFATVVINLPFDDSQEYQLEGLYLNNIDKISFLNKQFANKQDSLGPYFKPVCDHALRNVFHDKVRHVFHGHFKDVRVKRDHFYYESYSGRKHERYEEDSSDYSKTSKYRESDDDNDRYDDNDDDD